ncbi:DEKNAAC101593 [Brettanomyces naardenensis]|uniref:DEKNAAC101593 n=1 Tax=Brettanomyces naardenensis TaxID=13370 RepID=A0A448YIG3_BRENA|nr:DEKNAAC101593 [Brettanomyces naardenensis]
MNSDGVNQIVGSLQVIYNPRSSNEDRHKAEQFVEKIKQIPESPFWGYQLALPDNKYDYVVRHYGLNLLLNAITKDYFNWDLEKKLAVRNWVVELASKVADADPHYMKEKIAFLWVEIAKRCWGQCLVKMDDTKDDKLLSSTSDDATKQVSAYSEQEKLESWNTMDSNMLELWNHNDTTKELTLIIFRTLFEDVYLLDDPIVSQRSNVLSSLCPEVVTSEAILLLKYEPNEPLRMFAASQEGWLVRWCQLLDQCIEYLVNNENTADKAKNSHFIDFTTKILEVFKTSLYWILPVAFRQVNILQKLSELLKVKDIRVKTLAVDCFQVLFTRSYSDQGDFDDIVGSIFQTDGLAMLFKLFKSISLNPEDVDETKYTLLKKLVEMIVGLSEYLQSDTGTSKFDLPKTADIINYYKLVLETTRHDSLVVSGLSLQFWCSMLRIDELSGKSDFEEVMPDLLEVAANHLVSYSDYDPDYVANKYLEMDFENQPEHNTFLANYRKMNDDVVRIIICKKPKDGLQWLANRLNEFYASQIGSEALANPKLTYKGKGSEAFVFGYAQFVVIESCVRGISRWLIWYTEPDFDTQREFLIHEVDDLCKTMLTIAIKDPVLLRKQIQTLVQFTPLLKDVSGTMFKVLEKVMDSCTFEYPENASDDDRELIRDLRTSGGTELNRLAYLMPESLKNILPQLEEAIASILQSNKLSAHEAVAFKSFLLVVSQRSSIENKEERFSRIVDPELLAWSDPATEKGLLELHWFMERLGIVKIAEYFQSRGITADTNLLEAQMDEAGRQLKKELKDQWSSVFPIRATRIFIQYSIEKLDHNSETYQNLLKLWKPRIKPILPHILQLIYQIQAYHNPANWTGLPSEVQSFVKYSCMERFWQQGVSIQSKESFMDESVKAMHTLRDFADSVGHIIRYTREYAYLTISSISELEETLYEIPNSASLLWKALSGEPIGITLHSWRHMLNLVIRNVIKNCPLAYIDTFMAELIPQVLGTIDQLLMQKWEVVYRRGLQLEGNESDEQLSEEMMEEHMLRQLTAVVDRMLIDLVGQQSASSLNERQIKTRKLVFGNLSLLAPLLNLLCHIINIKDTRCSFNAILIVKHMIQDLIALDDPEVDKFLSENLIRSLLTVLTDSFYADVHPEAAYTLTILYMGLRYKSSYSAVILQQCLNLEPKELSQFESMLTNCKKLRERRNCFLQLISSSQKGGGGDDEAKRRDRKKQLEASRRSKLNNNLTDDPFEENNALSTLFGGE